MTTQESLPLVSVVIPFYNDLKFIDQSLRSCIDNTYPNMEIIIIDDFSKNPLKLDDLKADVTKRPISIIRNSSNRGSGCARNVGIKAAKGAFIAFLDADDIWMPEIIEKQMKVLLSDPTAVWVYTDGYYLIDGVKAKRPNSAYHGFRKQGFPAGAEVNKYHLRGYNYMTFSSNIFKKEALMDVGLFNEHLEVSEDWDLFVRMAEKYPVHAINEPLMLYRVNNSGRHFVNREGYVRVNTKILADMYKRQGLLPSRLKDFNLAVAMIYQRAGIQRMNAGKNQEARYHLFHSKTRPLMLQLRMICLRILSLLPPGMYKIALQIYDTF